MEKDKAIHKEALKYAEMLYRDVIDDTDTPIPANISIQCTSVAADYESFTHGANFGYHLALSEGEKPKLSIPQMTHPMGRSWDQPALQNITFTADDIALMSQKDFDNLAKYETSYPSGVYEGKMWRNGGRLMWFDNHPTDKDKCTCKSAQIAIVVKMTPQSFPEPKKKSLLVRLLSKFNS